MKATRVPAWGPDDAKIIIVGEGPGGHELRQGRPFVGPAGDQLKMFCQKAGFELDDCFITNVTKTKPTSSKDEYFGKPGNPSNIFVDGMAEMYQEIQYVRAKGGGNIVVALGNYALWALTGNWGINKWRGSILQSHVLDGLKIISTIHPAAILRGRSTERVLCVWDLRRAKEESESRELQLPDPEYIIDPNPGQIGQRMGELLEAEVYTCDTEWYSAEDLACVGFTCSEDWAICLDADIVHHREIIKKLLQSKNKKVFQNAMFDCVYLERAGYPVRMVDSKGDRLIEDTMIGHYVCWPDLRKGLDLLTSIYTRMPYFKEDRKVLKDGRNADQGVLKRYNLKDVVATHTSYNAIFGEDQELDWTGCRKTYELNMLTFNIMARATLLGIQGDWEELSTQILYHEERAKNAEEILFDMIERPINVRSPVQVARLVFDELGYSKQRKRSTAQAILMDLAAQESQPYRKTVLTLIVSIRRDRNARSKYVNETLFDYDGRLRSSWNLAGTENGRTSCSKDKFRGTGVSLQTMPYQVRSVCVADEGHTFYIPDLDQAEARYVAYRSEDWQVIDWIEEGLDLHCKTAELMFDIPYEDVGANSRERYLAKRCRHALNYMMGPLELKMTINKDFIDTGIGVTAAQAKGLYKKYLEMHAPLLMWWDEVKQELSRNSAIENCWGRRRRFTEAWGTKLFKSAVASEPQGGIADLNHMGGVAVDKKYPDIDLMVDTHDGWLMQVPKDKADEYQKGVKDCLTIPMQVRGREVIVPVSLVVADRWAPCLEVAGEG